MIYKIFIIWNFLVVLQQYLACDINAESLIYWNTKLDTYQIWSAPVTDLALCAKSCLRVKKCNSFNYELSSKLCDLNLDSSTNRPQSVISVPGVLHSNIADWPPTLDPDCSTRPCSEDEVCVPVLSSEGSGTCSYSCMKFRSSPPPVTTSTTSTTTTTTPQTTTTTPANEEGEIRVVGGADNSQGRLEIYHNGGWSQLSQRDWNWRATRTACAELGYNFAGSYHRHEAYGKGITPAYNLKDIDCGPSHVRVRDCTISSYDNEGDDNRHLGITCFKEDMTGPEYLRIKDISGAVDASNQDGLAQVKYLGEWGTICGEGWSETNMFCELKNIDWKKDTECKKDCTISGTGNGQMLLSDVKCDGDEPHFFFCQNYGWGNLPGNCYDSKALNVVCQNK